MSPSRSALTAEVHTVHITLLDRTPDNLGEDTPTPTVGALSCVARSQSTQKFAAVGDAGSLSLEFDVQQPLLALLSGKPVSCKSLSSGYCRDERLSHVKSRVTMMYSISLLKRDGLLSSSDWTPSEPLDAIHT